MLSHLYSLGNIWPCLIVNLFAISFIIFFFYLFISEIRPCVYLTKLFFIASCGDHKKRQASCKGMVKTGVEAETPILWLPDARTWLIWKDPDAAKDWGQEKGITEDEMVGWHHQLEGHGFGWTLGVGDGQAWRAVVHEVAKSRTWLSDWTELRNW